MAEVYRAEQELAAGLFRSAALKVIRPEYSESPDFREMFLDEARVACTLSHANIVHIYEVGEADGRLYMAMELVKGETLANVGRALRDAGTRLSDEALFAVGISTCAALAAVHALKVEGGHVNLVHRDVSPHNLLLASDGTLKLIDFGIAKAATNRNLTNPGVTKGKAGYFSPEQAMGKQLDGRSDLFSLGVTLYKLASGQTPFDGYSTHHDRNSALVRGQWQPLQTVCPGLPQGLYDVVARAMQLKPDDRYGDAREMREALDRAAFDARLRVSQDALAGYVSPDGEVRAPKAAPRETVAATPTLPAPLPDGRRHTERVMPAPVAPLETPSQRRKRRSAAQLVAVFVGAVALGGGTVALLLRGEVPAPRPPSPEDVVAVREAPIAPPAPDAPGDTVDEAPGPEPVGAAGGGAAGPGGEEPGSPPPPVQRRPDARPPRPRPPPPAAPVAARVEEPAPQPIPPGFGTVRVGTVPANAATLVLLDGKASGPVPANLRVPSGRYTVELRLQGGKKSAAWQGAVFPDSTTILVFDTVDGRWQKSGR